MSLVREASKNNNDSTLRILEISNAEIVDIVTGFREERCRTSYRMSKEGTAELVASNQNQIFRIASLGKVFIAAAACLMIDIFSADSSPKNPYHSLQGAWDKSFTTLFNLYNKDSKISLLYGDPKVIYLLLHYKGVRNVNHLVFDPYGTLLQSEEDFLKTISQYTVDTNQQDTVDSAWCEYSNANYILIAIFLDSFLKSELKISLNDFIREEIFKPLEMNHTYLSFDDLQLHPVERRTRPHVVSRDGKRRLVIKSEESHGQFGAIEFATLGPYSSAYDLGLFFGAMNAASDGKPTGNISEDFVNKFFSRFKSNIVDGEETGYTLCGLFTTSVTTYPGCNSSNRLMSSDGEASKYTLGTMEKDKALELYYLQGSATGWGCTVYYARDKRVFVIVLTNTSGLVDVSDPISRLYLQEIFDLRPSKEGNSNYKCRPKGWESMSHPERHRAHYVELVTFIYKESVQRLSSFEKKDKVEDTDIANWGGVCGIYGNSSSRQYLNIENCDGKLRIRMRTESKPEWSRYLRLVRNKDRNKDRNEDCNEDRNEDRYEDTYRICSMDSLTEHTYRGLGIDCFGAWSNLEFQAQRNGDQVICLSRKGLNLEDFFVP